MKKAERWRINPETALVSLIAFVACTATAFAQTQDGWPMTGILTGVVTATKDEGGDMKEMFLNLVCKQTGSDVTCVTPGGKITWKGTYADKHLTLSYENGGEFVRLIGDLEYPDQRIASFKGTMTGRYRRLLFWYALEGVWQGVVH